MKPLAYDTPLPVEQRWIAGLRAKGPLWRLHCLADMTSFCWRAASDAVQRGRPASTPEEREMWLLRERYGDAIAQRVSERYTQPGPDNEAGMTPNRVLWEALLPVVEALESLGVPYYVGGSVASSVTGVARATLDVDLVAALRLEHAVPLAAALAEHYYVDAEMIASTVQRCTSFNVIHLATMFKVDVFVPEDTPFSRANMQRRLSLEVPEVGRTLYICAPEDMVLHKLLWYRAGSGISERQWYDLQGILRLQAPTLDRGYLGHWAAVLDLTALLRRALDEAGLGAE